MRRPGILGAALVLALAAPAVAPAAFDPLYEQQNYSKIDERAKRDAADPEFQRLLREAGVRRQAEKELIRLEDPEREFTANLCSNHMDGCAGDVRMYDWADRGAGMRKPVLWTARNGATISGHLWKTRSGPPKRPGIVITSGSVQAPEELYWFAAASLAKAGYVVMTFDVQGQGYSDTYGEGADRNEGVPAQNGRPFFDQTEDGMDFFLSTPGSPYVPRRSCTTGTSHAPKHQRRVAEGRNAAHNPFWDAVDPERIGIAGQSFGASGVSFVGPKDPRVDAVVGWDNLRPATAEAASDCATAPETRKPAAAMSKPSLGIANDYGLFRQPNTSEPDPQAKTEASRAATAAGVDSGELVIRGGTHYEGAYIPNPYFSATLRGIDLLTWYTIAWFDKYVKGDPTADARLLTTRWREDRRSAAVDPTGDANMLSRYHRSRLDIGRAGGPRVVCEDLREGCPALAPDGLAPDFDYVEYARRPDGPAQGEPGSAPRPQAPPPAFLPATRDCRSRRVFSIRIARRGRPRPVRGIVYINDRRVARVTGKRLRARVDLRGLPRGTVRVRVSVRYASGRTASVTRRYKTCAKRR
jgi:dienelactone hydrolase